jgi:formylmethanofuran dehydrogenase subunit E
MAEKKKSNIALYWEKKHAEEGVAKKREDNVAERAKTTGQIQQEQKEAEEADRKERAKVFVGLKNSTKPGEIWCPRCGNIFTEAQTVKLHDVKCCPKCCHPAHLGHKPEEKK